MKIREQTGVFLSTIGGNILAGKKARKDTERNRRRLEEASLVSRELKAQRISDTEIKKLTASLVYEADAYIAAARESEGAFYEPLILDALDSARAAVNSWKKNENDAAALKYVHVNGYPASGGRTFSGDIVIPGDSGSGVTGVETAAAEDCRADERRAEDRARTLGILLESLRLFLVQNSIRAGGDPDAALAALAGGEYQKITGGTGT